MSHLTRSLPYATAAFLALLIFLAIYTGKSDPPRPPEPEHEAFEAGQPPVEAKPAPEDDVPLAAGDDLSVAEERVLRNLVYEGRLLLGTAIPVGGAQIVVIPEPLAKLYKAKPAPVLALLTRIVDGANPKESAKAASYALALANGPGEGVAVAFTFKLWKDKYDDFDKVWGMTPRQHWMGRLHAAKEEREKQAKEGD